MDTKITARKQSWSFIDLEDTAENDPLFACLVLLTRYYKNPFSPLSLVARLPLVDSRLTVELIPRAAARASLETELLQLKNNEIKDAETPSILIKNDNTAVLLVLDDHGNKVVLDPKQPENF